MDSRKAVHRPSGTWNEARNGQEIEMFDASTPADVVIEALESAGVSPVEWNDFLSYRKAVARNSIAATKASMAAKKADLIKKHPILVDLDQYLTAVGR